MTRSCPLAADRRSATLRRDDQSFRRVRPCFVQLSLLVAARHSPQGVNVTASSKKDDDRSYGYAGRQEHILERNTITIHYDEVPLKRPPLSNIETLLSWL